MDILNPQFCDSMRHTFVVQSLSLNNKNEKNRIVNTIPVNIEVNLTISVNSVIILSVMVYLHYLNLVECQVKFDLLVVFGRKFFR